MIIKVIDQMCITIFKFENDPIITRDCYRPISF